MILNARQRKALDASDFGLPNERKYPMPDAEHVRLSIRYFKNCPPKERPILAKNIIKKARYFNVKINPKKSPIAGYIPLDLVSKEESDIITEASNIGMLSPIVGAIPSPPANNEAAQAIYDFAIGKIKIEEDDSDIIPMVRWNIPEECWNITNESYEIADTAFDDWVIKYKNDSEAYSLFRYMVERTHDKNRGYGIDSDIDKYISSSSEFRKLTLLAPLSKKFPSSPSEYFLSDMVKLYLTKNPDLFKIIRTYKDCNMFKMYKFGAFLPSRNEKVATTEGFADRIKIRIQDFIKSIKVTSDGKVKMNLRDRLSFSEYESIHKVIMMNRESENIPALKDNLVYIFSIIALIEKEYIDKAHRGEIDKNSQEYKDIIRLRALLVSDYKVNLRYVLSKDKKFNFMKYYEESTRNNSVYEVDPKLLNKLGMLFKMLLI